MIPQARLGLAGEGRYNPAIMNASNNHRLAVIFDMDGVLVDSYDAHFRSWNRMLGEKGLSVTREQFAATFGRTSREIIKENWPEQAPTEADIAAWDSRKEQAYREILRESFPEMPGAGELIAALDEAGFALAIGSSGPPANVQVVLDCLANADRFDVAITGDDVRRGKPDPEVFLKAAGEMGVDPAACAVVEDAVPGLQAARRAGMTPIAITGTAEADALAEHAVVVVESLTELSPARVTEWIRKPQAAEDAS
jgi:beta-phosphoglucomutase